jgi:hypothetical protein
MNDEGIYGANMSEPQVEQIEQCYTPSAGDILKNYEVTIKPLDSGATVRVGCKTIAFSTLEAALIDVNLYFKDPQTSYKHWMKEFNK